MSSGARSLGDTGFSPMSLGGKLVNFQDQHADDGNFDDDGDDANRRPQTGKMVSYRTQESDDQRL
jgi:hypothetical protein